MIEVMSKVFELGQQIARAFGLEFALIVWKPGSEHDQKEVLILSPGSSKPEDTATVLSTARSFYATSS
tara:strand:- start:129 stop:332 length:204 start_codon:yes stop_codon:yes gene_type:complete